MTTTWVAAGSAGSPAGIGAWFIPTCIAKSAGAAGELEAGVGGITEHAFIEGSLEGGMLRAFFHGGPDGFAAFGVRVDVCPDHGQSR